MIASRNEKDFLENEKKKKRPQDFFCVFGILIVYLAFHYRNKSLSKNKYLENEGYKFINKQAFIIKYYLTGLYNIQICKQQVLESHNWANVKVRSMFLIRT